MATHSLRIHSDKDLSSPLTVSTVASPNSDFNKEDITSPSLNSNDAQKNQLAIAIQVLSDTLGLNLGNVQHNNNNNNRGRSVSRSSIHSEYGEYTTEHSMNDSYNRDRSDSLDSEYGNSNVGSIHNTPHTHKQHNHRSAPGSRRTSQSNLSSLRQIEISEFAGVKQVLDIGVLKEAQNKVISDAEAEEKQKTELQINDEELEKIKQEQKEAAKRIRQPLRWNNRVFGIINLTLVVGMVGLTAYTYLSRYMSSGDYKVFALFLLLPFSVMFIIFGIQVLVINANNMLGPVSHIKQNSPYYSCMPPLRRTDTLRPADKLPMVTIEIPVYKETFREVLKPTLESCMIAVRTFESQGGKANIFVNDDGMFLIPPEQQVERMMYYFQNNIAWVARPVENRRGKFKKASNMNFCLSVAQRVNEQLLNEIKVNGNNNVDTNTLRQQLLNRMAEEEKFMAGGPVELGSYIILLDCDSRIPADCMLDVVTELEESPEVAFTQHATQPMQVVHNYWENCIAHFTTRVYNTAIAIACSGGDISPLVGHNAFLRWSALEECSFIDTFDNKRKYWSEEHVSEDFDLAVRMYHKGYTGRYITYQEGWTEGVSLCVRDEITRFQKYAYGAAEVMFNPIPHWFKKGIMGDVARRLITAPNLGWTSKLNVLAYIGTYFAMTFSILFGMLNFFMYEYSSAWRNDTSSGSLWMSVTLVFAIIAPVGNVALGYRIGQHGFILTLMKEFMYTFQLCIFFTGLSIHLNQAIWRRLFNLDMQFGATAKEIVLTNFFKELKLTLKTYKYMYLVTIFCIIVIVIFNGNLKLPIIPPKWQVTELWSIWPVAMVLAAHMLAPIVLNPVLMKFSF